MKSEVRPVMTRALVVTVAVAGAAALSACGDNGGGTPVQRGYGSRQISQLRDTKFYFEGARGDIILYGIGTAPVDTINFTIDLRTGLVTEDPDPGFADVPYPQYTFPSDPNARYHCSYDIGTDGTQEIRIADAQTGQSTTLTDVALASNCPTDGDPSVMVWRFDGNGHQTLWTGPFDNLQMAPLDLTVVNPIGGLTATSTAVTVLAGRSATRLGIYSIDLTTFASTELVPPVSTGATWADGATPTGVLDSATLDPKAPIGVGIVGDHFLYWRAMADGGETLFAGPLTSGPARELALFSAGGSSVKLGYLRTTMGKNLSLATLPTWQRGVDPTRATSDLLIWDDVRQRLLTCPAAFQSTAVGVLSDDHSRLLEFVLQDPIVQDIGPELPTGPLLLVDLTAPASGSTACATIVDANVNVAGLAPDGSTMFWLVEPPLPAVTSQLYLAAPDGSEPRLVDDDRIEGPPHAPHFVGPSQLEVDIFADLVWTDVHDDPLVSHPIAQRTTGAAIDRGRWLIIGYDKSGQDGTATLGIVNRDTGEKRVISPDVATFFSPDLPDALGFVRPAERSSTDPLRIVYLVRGHNPSPSDGLWVANIYPSDTP